MPAKAKKLGIDLSIQELAGRRVKDKCYRVAVCDNKDETIKMVDSLVSEIVAQY